MTLMQHNWNLEEAVNLGQKYSAVWAQTKNIKNLIQKNLVQQS